MAIIKCKMCGGDIEFSADKTYGTCDSCGSTMTLPKIDDDQRAAQFNRGNHFRRSGEFDKALAVYERIVTEDDSDAEAHWCCALCRFGIEYVEDPNTYEFIPTCHRASFDSFLEDVDYLAALEHSDGVTKRQYMKDAAKIAEVQRGILATSQNEEPFDVFICYKETAEDGQRTKDSTLAQDIYYQLTEAGYRVFFSRITLEDKAGTEYEPYIFAALNSAKIMVAIGTKPEYFNAVWVKNEWSRFLAMMRKDRSKLLLPCYRDMDPYDLPEQLSVLQSYDMSKIGFMQDLLRGIKKVLAKDEPKPEAVIVQQTVGGNTNAVALLKRGSMALEDGEWDNAKSYFDQVLNMDAECGEAYLGLLLAEKQCRNDAQLIEKYTVSLDALTPERLTVDVEEIAPRRAEAEAKYAIPRYLEAKQLRAEYLFDNHYESRCKAANMLADKNLSRLNVNRNFSRAKQFSCTRAEQIGAAVAEWAQRLPKEAEAQENDNRARLLQSVPGFLENADARAAVMHEDALARRASDYAALCDEMSKAKSESDYRDIAGRLMAFGDFRDAKERTSSCLREADRLMEASIAEQKRIAREKDEESERQRMIREREEKLEKEKKKKTTIIGVVAAVIVIAAIIVVSTVVIPGSKYKAATELMNAGQYEEAIAAFEALNGFKDSTVQIENCQTALKDIDYYAAVALMDAGQYEEAVAAFEAMDGYRDSVEQILKYKYKTAELLMDEGRIAEAAMMFGSAKDYMDARERSFALWDQITQRETVSAGGEHTVGLKSDGTVVAVGDNNDGQCEVSGWTDIIAVCAGHDHTVGLKSDGTVVAAGDNYYGECNVSDWTDIVAISAGEGHTVGLKSDGTVVAAGRDKEGQCRVSKWANIVAISAETYHTVGLKMDGTVVEAGEYIGNVSGWTDIVEVGVGHHYAVGLKSDATVVTVGFYLGQDDVADWTDIVEVSAAYDHTVGLKSDGTVVAVGSNLDGQCNVSGWTDIVAVSAGSWHTVGLKSDGTVVATKIDGGKFINCGQSDVSSWTDIRLPSSAR